MRLLLLPLCLLLVAAGCAGGGEEPPPPATRLGEPTGRWTNLGPTPLTDLITGLELTGSDTALTGSLFLSGRALQGSGSFSGNELVMRFPSGSGEFQLRGTFESNSVLAVEVLPPGADAPRRVRLSRVQTS